AFCCDIVSDWSPLVHSVPSSSMLESAIKRLRRILRNGSEERHQAPSVDEVSIAKKTLSLPRFGCSGRSMLQQRQRGFPELEQPWILTVLTEDTIRLGGQLTEGIFRNPGDFDALNVARTQLEQLGSDSLQETERPLACCHVAQGTGGTIDPNQTLQRALDCHDRPDEALALVARQLSPLNQRVLRHVIRFLRLFAEPNVTSVTGIDAAESASPAQQFPVPIASDFAMDNARQEAAFVRLLLLHLPESAAAMGGGSGGGGGLLGLSSLSVIYATIYLRLMKSLRLITSILSSSSSNSLSRLLLVCFKFQCQCNGHFSYGHHGS
uniref:Rho-GAP domain-containing protein n=1 Tax=Macrostomum lignano TaxID=282301 RepID=A0A1I8F4E0_9PLAT